MTTMKVVGWKVEPVVTAILDSGLELAVPVSGTMVPADQWGAFKAGGDMQSLAPLRLQVEGPSVIEPSAAEPLGGADG